MTIGIDIRLYGARHGGIGRYTEELIRNLLTIDRENGYVFFVYSKEDEEQIRADIPKGARSRIRFILSPYRCYTIAEQIFMPLALARAKVDLMHFTHFNVPLLFNITFLRRRGRGRGIPFIVTIHDLIIHHFPDERATTLPKWLYCIKLAGYKAVMHRAVEKARIIIAPSEATKKDILRFYTIDEKKIKVVYEGVSKLKSEIRNPKSETNSKFQITNLKPYLLYVGSFYPHKNIERLIDAFHILRAKYNLDIKLVLVGKKDYFQKQVQKYLSAHYPLTTTHCIFDGHASEDELAELYQNAAVFVFPSLYEGFGLPPLEAMRMGSPVATANTSSIPEICKDAALYFNPENGQDIAEKIHLLYTNPQLQNELRGKGYKLIKSYSWRKMAEMTLQIYENVI